jgi:hypothetical protein
LIQRPLAAVLAVACAAGVLALGFAPGMDLALRMTVAIAAVLGLLLAAGALRHHAMAERLRGANLEREQRFVSLLGIAVDAYWELDAAYRLTMLSRRVRDGSFVADDVAEPCEPWDLPHVQFDEDTLDSLRADLEAREPFRDVPLRVAYGTPAERHLLISGEPRRAAPSWATGASRATCPTTCTRAARWRPASCASARCMPSVAPPRRPCAGRRRMRDWSARPSWKTRRSASR